MFKFLNSGYCSNIFMRQNIRTYNLRNVVNNLAVPNWRKTLSQNSPFYKGPLAWNSLSQDLKLVQNINVFKRRYKLHLLQLQENEI